MAETGIQKNGLFVRLPHRLSGSAAARQQDSEIKFPISQFMMLNRVLLLFTSLFFLLFLISCSAEDPAMESGLITFDSPFSFEETGSRIRTILEERDMLIPADLNHQQNAANVDLDLLPTRVIIFGNPNLGTPLMQCSQSIAIDLPQKILIWEDESGAVHVAYNDSNYLKQRHGAEGCDEAFDAVADALNGLVESALSQ